MFSTYLLTFKRYSTINWYLEYFGTPLIKRAHFLSKLLAINRRNDASPKSWFLPQNEISMHHQKVGFQNKIMHSNKGYSASFSLTLSEFIKTL